jgi:hypothetical protein
MLTLHGVARPALDSHGRFPIMPCSLNFGCDGFQVAAIMKEFDPFNK